ncbi:hypothetical protein GCM10023189_59630 [Nibrella saemangeumensis]|uniref:RadC-like JAB domain-containing protein n=1 Tax=Nibrella saemangeumensis TaxID=1084526 RepID=A0ABP8NQ89_9BACT
MSNIRTPDQEAEGGPSVTEFNTLAEALLYLNRQRQVNDALYCIVVKDDVFYVTQFTLGRRLLEDGYLLIYGG